MQIGIAPFEDWMFSDIDDNVQITGLAPRREPGCLRPSAAGESRYPHLPEY